MRQMWPAMDRFLCFHQESFDLILVRIGTHVASFIGLTLMGKPRYIKGSNMSLQFKIEDHLSKSSKSTPMPPKQLFGSLLWAWMPLQNNALVI